MNIQLPPDLEAELARHQRNGNFRTPDDVIADALRHYRGPASATTNGGAAVDASDDGWQSKWERLLAAAPRSLSGVDDDRDSLYGDRS